MPWWTQICKSSCICTIFFCSGFQGPGLPFWFLWLFRHEAWDQGCVSVFYIPFLSFLRHASFTKIFLFSSGTYRTKLFRNKWRENTIFYAQWFQNFFWKFLIVVLGRFYRIWDPLFCFCFWAPQCISVQNNQINFCQIDASLFFS